MIRLVAVLLLAAAFSADGATTVLVRDTASSEVPLTAAASWQYFTITPNATEAITFTYLQTSGVELKAYAKRGGCPTYADHDFANNRYSAQGGYGGIYVDPCSGSGEICFGVNPKPQPRTLCPKHQALHPKPGDVLDGRRRHDCHSDSDRLDSPRRD